MTAGRFCRRRFFMHRPTAISAGLLLFRRTHGELEVFLVHPGGPFWKNRDAGAWSIPKGLVDPGEEPLAAACRELTEETGITVAGPFIPLGPVQQKSGKLVHAWACEANADENTIISNTTRIELPCGSGRWLDIPEIDRAAWLSPKLARQKINPAQAELIDRLEKLLVESPS
jgi:predicted NUDIX family NTP pyrophosphohydrolase